MTTHRLPGMSIEADVGQDLTDLADDIAATRTDPLDLAIVLLVRSCANPDVHS